MKIETLDTYCLNKIFDSLSTDYDIKVIEDPSHIKDFVNEKDNLIVFPYEEESIRLIEYIRFQLESLVPILFLSFETGAETRGRFTRSPENNEPIIEFGKGMYHKKLPAKLPELIGLINNVKPLPKSEQEKIKERFEFLEAFKKDRDFRHRVSNFTSSIRILQGAYYLNDITTKDYNSALDSLKIISQNKKALNVYTSIIEEYQKSIPALKKWHKKTKPAEFPASDFKILLLDDEAETAGWSVVFKIIYNSMGFNFAFKTDRNQFEEEIEENETLDCDILLLDLKMPDSPDKSIRILERIKEKFSDTVVIVFTAINDIKYFKSCKKAGAFEYFVKEFGAEDQNPLEYYGFALIFLISHSSDYASGFIFSLTNSSSGIVISFLLYLP